MIRHLLTLVWNRKRTNFLIGLEIFLSFAVLCSVASVAVYFWDSYRQPLGFSYQDVWHIEIAMGAMPDSLRRQTGLRVLAAVQGFEGVEAVAAVMEVPFDDDFNSHLIFPEGVGRLSTRTNVATDGLARVLALDVVEGRWFNEGDDGLDYPVVVNRQMARNLFGEANPLGKTIKWWDEGYLDCCTTDRTPPPPYTVVGVINDFRGDVFMSSNNFLFHRFRIDQGHLTSDLLIRVRPGTPAVFGEQLLVRLKGVAPQWQYRLNSLEKHRQDSIKTHLVFLVGGGVVAGLLVIMVSLGLVGVLWQNVTQRLGEIGLRKALGGTAGQIYIQFLGEVLLVASVAMGLALALLVQLPLADMLIYVDPGVYVAGTAMAALLIYLLVIGCALYPGWLASRVPAATALHYE